MTDSIELPFVHRQSAHCESGVLANLLSHHGIPLSEPMAFGLGAGLFFAYLPMIRINHLPLVTYRAAAGQLLRRVARLSGFCLERRTYASPARAMADLDALLAQSIPVGLQTGVFWLPYFPSALRFHFNAHNLVVYGKRGDDYLISDPVFPEPVTCPGRDLARARFASGALAPKGRLYYFTAVPAKFDRADAIVKGIAAAAGAMKRTPFPLVGVSGIRFLAGRLRHWQRRLGADRAALHLGHVVRMQEEIGTGGGGFRFLFAAFLQESATVLGDDRLRGEAERITTAGDCWREFAAMAARICKGRAKPEDSYPVAADLLLHCADMEEQVFAALGQWARENSR